MGLHDTLTFEFVWVWVLLCVGVAAWARRTALSGKKNWNNAWAPIKPTLEAKPSPMASVKQGITGLLTWFLGWVIMLVALLLAVDLISDVPLLIWLSRLLLNACRTLIA